jgi:3-oxoacyl-[acyl-carrier protein] reductase
MELQGKTAIVTGSARGIGEGSAVALAKEGATVVVKVLPPQAEFSEFKLEPCFSGGKH